MRTNKLAIEGMYVESCEGIFQARERLLGKQYPCLALSYGVQGPTGSVGDDGSARGHCLQCDDARVFVLRKEECLCARIQGRELAFRYESEKFHRRACERAQTCFILPGSRDLEADAGFICKLNQQIEALVGNEPSHSQEIAVSGERSALFAIR